MAVTERNVYAESSEIRSQVDELFTHIRSFRRFPKGFRAIHMHFSVLDRLHQQPHHRRSIATAFNGLIAPYDGKLYWTKPFDLFFICKGCPPAKLEKAKIDAIRAVDDSPIIKEIIAQGDDGKLCDWYDLSQDYNKLYNLVKAKHDAGDDTPEIETAAAEATSKTSSLKSMMAKLGAKNKKEEPSSDKAPLYDAPIMQSKTVPLYKHIFPKNIVPSMNPIQLDKLERNLLSMDMYAQIAEQNICVVMENMPPEIVFTKKYISLNEVNNSILPDCNIAGDKWLFQRLTRTFDIKVMQSLVDNKSFPEQVLSINMNVATILTKDFDNFIAKQKKLSDQPIILEITLFDIMSDLTEYYMVQKKLERLGCKICISRMDIQSLYVLDRELINVDFLKISWNKNYLTSIDAENKKRIADAIKAQGKMRVVLSGCGSQNAIRFGTSLGIVMYQGFEIDKLQGLSKEN